MRIIKSNFLYLNSMIRRKRKKVLEMLLKHVVTFDVYFIVIIPNQLKQHEHWELKIPKMIYYHKYVCT